MKNEPKGGELFVVDNSVSGWTGLRGGSQGGEFLRARPYAE